MRRKFLENLMLAIGFLTVAISVNAIETDANKINGNPTYSSMDEAISQTLKTTTNTTASAEPEVATVVLSSDSTPYQIALQNNMTVEELDALNQGEIAGKELLKAGESIKLPANSIMAKLAQPKQATNTQTSAITLPSLGNGKKSDDESYLTQILDEVPAANYLENDAEKNTAIVVQEALTRDWEDFEAQELVDDAEIWAENYVDGKVNAAKSKVLSQANNYLNKPINDLLGRFGTAQFSLSVDEKGDFTASDFKLFSPLYDVDQNLVFGQVGVHEQGSGIEERLIGNFGLGYRYDTTDYLIGGNVFIDHDFTGSNTRLGLGGEYWRDYLKLAVNYYSPLSDWKSSEVLLDFEERPAEGFDIRTQAYLPSYPQLGGSLMYEQYFGDEVAYFGIENRQSDPYAVTVGIDYTPIPLITTNAGYTLGKDGETQAQFDLDLNLQLGVPIEQQLDASRVADLRTLKGSRYDPVDRNYDIVFEYRAKNIEVEIKAIDDVIPLRTEAQIVKVKISAESKISNHVWYRFDEITQDWNQVADETDSSIEKLNDLRNSVGTYKYKLFVKTETGATGISNVVEVQVIAGQGATLTNVMDENEKQYVSDNTTWAEIDSFNEIETNPLYANKYIKLYYQTDDYYPDSYPIELFAESLAISRSKVKLLSINDVASHMTVNPGESLIGIKQPSEEPDDIDPENPERRKGWYIYVLADQNLLDVTDMQINFDFDALTLDDLTNDIVVSSDYASGSFYSAFFEPNVFADMYVELSVIDLGEIEEISSRSITSAINAEEYEKEYCENIEKYEDKIISKTTYKISTLDGKVLPSDLETQSVTIDSVEPSKTAKVNHYYGVCIIHTKSEVFGGEMVEEEIYNLVINSDVQNSIVWRYGISGEDDLYSKSGVDLRSYETEESGIQEILANPQDESKGARIARYNGLEGCRARMVFRTQTSNVDNNEFIWGELGEREIEAWTEQGLQLSVQFNTIDMNDGRVLPEINPVCPSYTKLVSATNAATDEFVKSGRFDENNIANDTLIPTPEGNYVGVWH